MWSSQGGHDCVSHRKGLPGVVIVTYPVSVPLVARSLVYLSRFARRRHAVTERRSFLPPFLSDRPGQPPPNSASISSLRGSLAPVGRPRKSTEQRVSQPTVDRKNCRVGRFVSLLPACPRLLERHQSPTTHHTHTDEPRSSLVLPLPSSSFTSRTPLLVIPPPTPCFELNRK
jgi:hypothetical protein